MFTNQRKGPPKTKFQGKQIVCTDQINTIPHFFSFTVSKLIFVLARFVSQHKLNVLTIHILQFSLALLKKKLYIFASKRQNQEVDKIKRKMDRFHMDQKSVELSVARDFKYVISNRRKTNNKSFRAPEDVPGSTKLRTTVCAE